LRQVVSWASCACQCNKASIVTQDACIPAVNGSLSTAEARFWLRIKHSWAQAAQHDATSLAGMWGVLLSMIYDQHLLLTPHISRHIAGGLLDAAHHVHVNSPVERVPPAAGSRGVTWHCPAGLGICIASRAGGLVYKLLPAPHGAGAALGDARENAQYGYDAHSACSSAWLCPGRTCAALRLGHSQATHSTYVLSVLE
jgi:hypothetical protein